MDSGRIIALTVTGAAVGAGLGYLLFTKPGKESLEKLVNGTGNFKEKIMTGIGSFIAGMTSKLKNDFIDENEQEIDFSREAAAPVV